MSEPNERDCQIAGDALYTMSLEDAQATVAAYREELTRPLSEKIEQLGAMLDRIAITSADYFDAAQEECIADGVDSMADRIVELESEIERLKSELESERADIAAIAHEVSLVYDELTNGRVSKPNTHASSVIAEAWDVQQQELDEAIAEIEQERDAALKQVSELESRLIYRENETDRMIKAAEERAEKAEREGACDACAGTGNPISCQPCMCQGTGRAATAVIYLRECLMDAHTELERVKREGFKP